MVRLEQIGWLRVWQLIVGGSEGRALWPCLRRRLRGVFGAASSFLRKLDARFTSKANIDATQTDVCFCAISGHDAFTAKLVSVPLRYGDRRIAGETVYNSIPTAKIVMM